MTRSSIYNHIVRSSILELKKQNYADGLSIEELKSVLSECFAHRGGFTKVLYLISQQTLEAQQKILNDINTDDIVRAQGPNVYAYMDWVRAPKKPFLGDTMSLMDIALLIQQKSVSPLPYQYVFDTSMNVKKYEIDSTLEQSKNRVPNGLWVDIAPLMYQEHHLIDFGNRYLMHYIADEDCHRLYPQHTALICASIIYQQAYHGHALIRGREELNRIVPYISLDTLKDTMRYILCAAQGKISSNESIHDLNHRFEPLLLQLRNFLPDTEKQKFDSCLECCKTLEVSIFHAFDIFDTSPLTETLEISEIKGLDTE